MPSDDAPLLHLLSKKHNSLLVDMSEEELVALVTKLRAVPPVPSAKSKISISRNLPERAAKPPSKKPRAKKTKNSESPPETPSAQQPEFKMD